MRKVGETRDKGKRQGENSISVLLPMVGMRCAALFCAMINLMPGKVKRGQGKAGEGDVSCPFRLRVRCFCLLMLWDWRRLLL